MTVGLPTSPLRTSWTTLTDSWNAARQRRIADVVFSGSGLAQGGEHVGEEFLMAGAGLKADLATRLFGLHFHMPPPGVEHVVCQRAEHQSALLCVTSGKDAEPHPHRRQHVLASDKTFRRPYLGKVHAAPAY